MSAPLDLTADRLESIRSRAVQGYAPTMRDTLNLVAEVERLRAESVPLPVLTDTGQNRLAAALAFTADNCPWASSSDVRRLAVTLGVGGKFDAFRRPTPNDGDGAR